MQKPLVVCLMGPTAAGKTGLAMRLADAFPLDIVSVDSALVYRGMDIGTAKPNAAQLERYPHRLIDIREPEEPYSAGDFVRDANAEIAEITARGRVPLLTGGTMMYFRALTAGIAELPSADEGLRAVIDEEAARVGWPAMHRQLADVDAKAARRINPNDSQRIQRALEVYRRSGKPLSDWQSADDAVAAHRYVKYALVPEPRAALHARIERRLDGMLDAGFIDEVRGLRARAELTAEHPSMRSVGYRQIWRYLDGEYDRATARNRSLAATRQLAKRQLTWLRSEDDLFVVNPLEADPFAAISGDLADRLGNGEKGL